MSSARSNHEVDLILFALADPTRRRIFESIVRTPGATTSVLCDDTKSISRWGVMKHMNVLRDAGLIQTMATGRLRRHYAEPARLEGLRQWLDVISR